MSITRWWSGLIALGVGCGQPPVIIDDAGASQLQPEVLLLVDTSGSNVWKSDCRCDSVYGCDCLPDCTLGERPRWHAVLEAISGSFEDYSCTAVQRTRENGMTYDLGYPRPHYQIGAEARQRPDGILDRYGDAVLFGLATFDSMRTYTGTGDLVPLQDFSSTLSNGAEGQFSYNGTRVRPDGSIVGRLFYPTSGEPYQIETGIVGPSGTEGALIMPRDPLGTGAIGRIKDQLRRVRPFGGTPTASALDDLYFAFADNTVSYFSPTRHVILITDGAPDDDFREYPAPGCDCAARGNCPAGENPADMSCPYPAAAAAAYRLHCGYDATTCAGPVARLDVITFGLDDADSRHANEEIASAGGGTAYHASSAAELQSALQAALDRIERGYDAR